MEQTAAVKYTKGAPAGGVLMVVDDDDMLRESMAAALTGRGFRVLEHASGQTALDALTHGELPDLILLDLRMPQMDGWEFRRRQLAHEVLASIPVVAVSGDKCATAATLDTAAFIAKPLAHADLVGIVEQVLAERAQSEQGRPLVGRIRSASVHARAKRQSARRARAQRGETLQTAGQTEAERRLQLFYVSSAMSHVVNNALQGLVSYAQCDVDASACDLELQRSAIDGALACSAILRRFADCTRREDIRDRLIPALERAPVALLEGWRQLCPPEVDLRVTGLDLLADARIRACALQQLLHELITNAVEAIAGKGGRVTVRVTRQRCELRELRATLPAKNRRSGLWCCIDVSDQGRGIAAQQLPHIWWPFYSTKFAGRGLGLAEVLATIDAHGGLVAAASALERGTTIRLLLPLQDARPALDS